MAHRAVPAGLQAFAWEKLAISTSAVAFTAATYSPATGDTRIAQAAYVTVETNSIRVRTDGADPVAASDGHLLVAGAEWIVVGAAEVKAFRAIQSTAGGTIQITYYR